MNEILNVVVDKYTGEELEREWYPPNHFKKGSDYGWNHTVDSIRVEDEETVRVFVREDD
jgi:hypothetical protein